MPNADIVLRFDEIYGSTQKEVLAFITARCKNTGDINDIFQDTYMELYQVITRRGAAYVTNGRALVYRIAKRKIARYYSYLERMKIFIPLFTETEDGEQSELPEIDAHALMVDDIAVNGVMLEMLKKHIKQKPELVKKVFYLFYDVGLTIPEIATTLHISESNVKHKLYRTLQELRDIYK